MADPTKENKTSSENNALKPDEDKVSYNVSISVPDIIAALHQKAIVTAQQKAKDIRVVNSALEANGKKAKLKSAGQHIISVLSTQKDGKVKQSDAIAALKEYVHWFVGPDLESKVTDKTVFSLEKEKVGDTPAADDSQPSGQQSSDSSQKSLTNEDDKKQLEDRGSVQNASGDKPADDGNNGKNGSSDDSNDQKTESVGSPVFVKSFKDFLIENCGLKFIFEENDLVPSGDNKPAKKEDGSLQKKEEDGALAKREGGDLVQAGGGDDKGKNDADPEASGWYIGYNLKVKGLKESKIKDALKQFAADWFDGLTITSSGLWGSGKEITGKQIRKSIHNALHIDHEKLAQDVSQYIKQKYPNTDEVDVRARDKQTLLKDLADAGAKVDASGKKKISGAAYSLTIKVKEEDPKKPLFNVKKVAEIIKKCMRFGFKKFKTSADDVIKVENFKDDNDAQSMSNNATRPSSTELESIVQKAKDQNAKDKSSLTKRKKLSATHALNAFTAISKRFQSLQKNKNANQEKENKRAIELFNDLKKAYEKASKVEGTPVDYSLFDDFLTKYKKFEAGLEESASMKIFSKRDVVQLLIESLFDEVPASEIFEADEDDGTLRKSTDADKEGAIDVQSTSSEGGNAESKDSKKDAKREEAKPDFKELSKTLQSFAEDWIKFFSGKAAVISKEDAINQLEDDYQSSISMVSSSRRKYAAVIDYSSNTSLHVTESLQDMLMNMLFEANEDDKSSKKRKYDDNDVVDAEYTMKDDTNAASSSSNDDSNDIGSIPSKIRKMFNEFMKKSGIKDGEHDDIIVLTQKVEESYARHAGPMLLEADDEKKGDKDDTDFIKDVQSVMNQKASEFGKAKSKTSRTVGYTDFAGSAEDAMKFFDRKVGIDISKQKDALSKHKYAIAFIVKMPKKDDSGSYNGSVAAKDFTDTEVKKIFKAALKSRKFEMLVVEGVAKKMKYNKSSVQPDVKVFIAAFDDEEKKPASKAYILPFDFYKDAEEKKEGTGEEGEGDETGSESSLSDAGESQTNEKAEGTDLYIFPIKSSKMFEETPDNDSK